MNPALRRLMNLVRKTGDRLVVTDPEGDEVFVLMGVDQYEALLQSDRSHRSDRPHTPPKDIWDAMPSAGIETETWDVEDLGKEEQELMARQYEAYLRGNHVLPESSLPKTAMAPEIPISEQAQKLEIPPISADLYNEDQFYLEPIE